MNRQIQFLNTSGRFTFVPYLIFKVFWIPDYAFEQIHVLNRKLRRFRKVVVFKKRVEFRQNVHKIKFNAFGINDFIFIS